MGKHGTKGRQGEGQGRFGLLLSARRALRGLVIAAGLEQFYRELEAEREALCGPRRRKQAERRAYRYGYDEGPLVFGGRKLRLPKPRVRSVAGQEVELATWREMQAEDPLEERVLEQILVGVSTRGYARSLEEVAPGVESVAVSRSSVSRRLIARTAAQVESFLGRALGDLDLPVILIDGTSFGEHVLVVALGIDAGGRKHVLGVVEGTTESEQVCRSLVRNLIERGLVVERARLFVIDGGKGVRKAIRTSFGTWALIQRCRVHKLRNLAEHLPKAKQAWVRATVRRAWEAQSADAAKRSLLRLAAQLEAQHPGAAASLREGLDETLTLMRLGVRGALLRTLCSTNPIENLQGTLKRIARNVKRWRGGTMALRWAVAGLIEAERRFHRVRGYRDLTPLMASLEAQVNNERLDNEERVA